MNTIFAFISYSHVVVTGDGNTPVSSSHRRPALSVDRSRQPQSSHLATCPRSSMKGFASIWAVVFLLITVMFMGLALDVGLMVMVGQQLQTAADAAALAGARMVRADLELARATAVDLAGANVAAGAPVLLRTNSENDPAGDIVIGRFSRDTGVFDPAAAVPNAIKVVARRTTSSRSGPLELLFGRVFGKPTVNMARTAIATIAGGTGAGLIVLNETDRHALDVSGNVHINVEGGAIQVNSSDSEAAYFGGSTWLDGSSVNVVGDYRITGTPNLPAELNTGVDPIPDPLAYLPELTWDPIADLGSLGGTVDLQGGEIVTIQPGYYPGGISINNGTLTLEPGIYILDGTGLDVTGSANFFAEGVMLYIVGTGNVEMTGGGEVRIAPPDPNLYSYDDVDTYEGIAIFQARDNTNEGTILGTSLMDLEGTYYFPSNHMNVGGDATKFGNQFIVNTMKIFGNGNLTITYDGRFPAPGSDVFLVF